MLIEIAFICCMVRGHDVESRWADIVELSVGSIPHRDSSIAMAKGGTTVAVPGSQNWPVVQLLNLEVVIGIAC